MNETQNAIIILAAGASVRMGSPKQLLPWGEDSLLQHTINQAAQSDFEKVIAVIGANSDAIKRTLAANIITLTNEDWQTGMGSSISCGVRFLLQEEYASILLMLADQPFIDTEHLNTMLSIFSKKTKGIVATDYDGKAGVPALFGQPHFKQLAGLNSEYGAKELLRQEGHDIFLLNAGAKTLDIDTKTDYNHLNQINR